MTRRQERRRRVADWAAIVAAGIVAAVAAGGWPGLGLLAAALAIGHRRMIAPPGVPVLTYHSVSPAPGWLPWADEIAVHPDTFARHLATLDAMGCTVIATDELVAARRAGRLPPKGAVVLHFDDGYLDNRLYAAPLLRRAGMPATFYTSLDFVEPEGSPRGGDVSGYMRWSELAALDGDPLFAVEPHGVDHGRVPVSTRIVDRLDADNWRRNAWMQWAATPGPKHDWFRRAVPDAVPPGTPVPQSAPALAAPRLGETQAAFEARVAGDLGRCVTVWRERLDRAPASFCWPENAVGADGRRIAAALGYRATTGGGRRNAAADPPETISRLHAGDRAIGFRWLPAEALWLRASVRLWQGNHYWYPLVAAMALCRRAVCVLGRGGRRGDSPASPRRRAEAFRGARP